jgi:hypothetical protein
MGQARPEVSQWSNECLAMACVLTPIISSIIIRYRASLTLLLRRFLEQNSQVTPLVGWLMDNRITKERLLTRTGPGRQGTGNDVSDDDDEHDAKQLSQLSLISYMECVALVAIIRNHITRSLAAS